MDGTINDRDNTFEPDPMAAQGNAMDDEDQDELDRLAEEKAKNATKTTQHQELFRDPDGADFDPTKKFGNIETEGTLIYDNITSSYPLNMPADHYQKYIAENVPQKESGDGKWYIRPHHLESLTKHPQSVKDDVLNTRYVSHYDQTYGIPEEVNVSE